VVNVLLYHYEFSMRTFNICLKFIKRSDIILISLVFHDSENQGFVILIIL